MSGRLRKPREECSGRLSSSDLLEGARRMLDSSKWNCVVCRDKYIHGLANMYL